MITKDLGAVSAYAYAVEKGYTGTEAEYAELMASYASVAEEAAESAESAQASATTANSAASTATNKASEATTAAQTATAKAEEAQADADAAALDASQALSAASTATSKASEAAQSASDAVTAKTAAQTAQTAAEGSATTAQTAAQTATQKAAEAAESARTLTIDKTLTQEGQAAEAKKTGDEITSLKKILVTLDGKLGSPIYTDGYIINSQGSIGAVVSTTGYKHTTLIVSEGEKYNIVGSGASSARLWSTHTADGTTVRVADSGTIAIRTNPIELTIGATERYLVFNSDSKAKSLGVTGVESSESTYNTRHLIETIVDEKAEEINADIAEIENDINISALTFRNNLSTDGESKLPAHIINGNYGESGASYHFSDIPTAKMHLYFEFQQTAAIPNANVSGSVSSKRLISAFGNSYFILQYAGSVFSRNELYQQNVLQLISGSSVTLPMSVPVKYARIQGKDAFSVKYTGAVSSSSVGTVEFTDSACIINIDGTTTTIDCTASTTLTDLVDAINAVSGIEAKEFIVNGKTYGDLLPVVSKMTATSSTVNLIYSGVLSDSTQYYDATEIYIPLAVDESWHSVEMIFDPDGLVTAALDGVTVSKSYSGAINNNTVILNHNNAPFEIRNLVVDYDTQGDAEVIDNQASSSYTPAKQLISDHNPHLLIFEGHGVDVCAEADAPITDNMACSTERLRILFDAARANGYVPVTWEQVINWKLNGGTLPKRCFTIMFDDWRFPNFIDYEKRNPFVGYNVRAGLAVITNNTALTDTVTINGLSYTGEQCVNIVKTAGWYPCSHTHTHRLLTASKPSETDALLKNDVIGADRYGIYSNILVYPKGEYGEQYKGCMKHSNFVLGITIVADNYNCRGTDNYFLSRVELGTRESLESVLSLLV